MKEDIPVLQQQAEKRQRKGDSYQGAKADRSSHFKLSLCLAE